MHPERVLPRFERSQIDHPIDLLNRNGDPRKTSYVVGLFAKTRETWHKFSNLEGRSYSPTAARLLKAEGLLEPQLDTESNPKELNSEEALKELSLGKSPRVRENHYEVRQHMAPEHIVTVMAGVEALGQMVYENMPYVKYPYMLDLEKHHVERLLLAAALHDLNKDIEFKATRLTLKDEDAGFGQAGYDLASDVSEQKLRIAGVPEKVIILHKAVGHTSCPEIEEGLRHFSTGLVDELIIHYIDDIVTDPNIIDPSITVAKNGERLNALDRRCIQNESKAVYAKYNEAWKKDPRNKTGETAFAQQRRVGHLVENYLASLIDVKDPLTLPQLISERIKENMQRRWDQRGQKPKNKKIEVKPFDEEDHHRQVMEERELY